MNKAPKWDAILFDVDGTLIDSIPFIVESFQHAFWRHLGHPLDEATILAGIGTPLETAFSPLAPGTGQGSDGVLPRIQSC